MHHGVVSRVVARRLRLYFSILPSSRTYCATAIVTCKVPSNINPPPSPASPNPSNPGAASNIVPSQQPQSPKTTLKTKHHEHPLVIKSKPTLESTEQKSLVKDDGILGVDVDDDDDEEDEEKHKRKMAERQTAHDKAIFATKLGAGVNVLLSALKGTIGLAISSTALIADAASGLGDVFGDAVVYFTVKEARKRATPDRPWGRGKAEPLGALSVGALLMVGGAGIGYSASMVALDTVQQALPALSVLESVHHASPTPITAPSLDASHFAALAVSATSIISKEALFRYTLTAGQKANSSAVIANAWQHRADVSTSLAVFAGLIGKLSNCVQIVALLRDICTVLYDG